MPLNFAKIKKKKKKKKNLSRNYPVLDPLAMLHRDNQPYIDNA